LLVARMARSYSGIAKRVLLYLAVAGVVAIAATSPYFLLGFLQRLGKKSSERKKLQDAFKRLKKSQLVILREENGAFFVELTEKGRRTVQKIQFQDLSPQKSSRWDGVWRIVIFDIPNKKKAAREVFRKKLKEWEFYQLQESVWVCLWPCAKELEILVESYGIESYVNMIEARRIKNDVKLKAHFKLL